MKELFNYLIEKYNLAMITPQLERIIRGVNQGVFNQRRCKEIDCETLLDMWHTMEQHLDKIKVNNELSGKEITGESAVRYDLTCLINSYDLYLLTKRKLSNSKENISIELNDFDVNNFNNNKKRNIDLSEIYNDIFN